VLRRLSVRLDNTQVIMVIASKMQGARIMMAWEHRTQAKELRPERS